MAFTDDIFKGENGTGIPGPTNMNLSMVEPQHQVAVQNGQGPSSGGVTEGIANLTGKVTEIAGTLKDNITSKTFVDPTITARGTKIKKLIDTYEGITGPAHKTKLRGLNTKFWNKARGEAAPRSEYSRFRTQRIAAANWAKRWLMGRPQHQHDWISQMRSLIELSGGGLDTAKIFAEHKGGSKFGITGIGKDFLNSIAITNRAGVVTGMDWDRWEAGMRGKSGKGDLRKAGLDSTGGRYSGTPDTMRDSMRESMWEGFGQAMMPYLSFSGGGRVYKQKDAPGRGTGDIGWYQYDANKWNVKLNPTLWKYPIGQVSKGVMETFPGLGGESPMP